MDASELATIAFEAMPMSVLTPIDQGQVYGVLAMALQTLEMQHAALLAEADEETAEAKKLWREALAELDAALADRDAILAANHALNEELRKVTGQCDLMAAEFDAKQRELDELRSARDETVAGLQAENARLHRSLEERMSVRIPGAVQVAKTEELHGMADVFAQSQRMQGNA